MGPSSSSTLLPTIIVAEPRSSCAVQQITCAKRILVHWWTESRLQASPAQLQHCYTVVFRILYSADAGERQSEKGRPAVSDLNTLRDFCLSIISRPLHVNRWIMMIPAAALLTGTFSCADNVLECACDAYVDPGPNSISALTGQSQCREPCSRLFIY